MKVYVLWHIHTIEDDYGEHDDEKLIGIYSTKEKAETAIEEHKALEGFQIGTGKVLRRKTLCLSMHVVIKRNYHYISENAKLIPLTQ